MLLLIIHTLSHDALFPCGNSCHYERCIIHFVYFALWYCVLCRLLIYTLLNIVLFTTWSPCRGWKF